MTSQPAKILRVRGVHKIKVLSNQAELIGRQVRIVHGPHAGKEGTISGAYTAEIHPPVLSPSQLTNEETVSRFGTGRSVYYTIKVPSENLLLMGIRWEELLYRKESDHAVRRPSSRGEVS